MSETAGAFGKKVFFLNPPSVIDEVLPQLADAEYEVYTIKDHNNLLRYIKQDPECMVFVNIDEGSDEAVWKKWIQSVREDEKTAGIPLGVVTMLGDDDQRQGYLMDLGVQAGFIVLKMGVAKTTEILLKTLEANEARGRRKYVRTKCPPDSSDFNYRSNGELVRGQILDLSIAGMAAIFQTGLSPALHSRMTDIQLNLRGIRLLVNGIVMGAREDTGLGSFRLIMFEPGSLDENKRRKLRGFIGKTLQAAMLDCIASV